MSEREIDDGRCCENGYFGQQHNCMKQTPAKSEPLIGWMIFEACDDDRSHWDGVISYPNPTGANLAWENPIKMIEYSAYEALRERCEDYSRRWNEEIALADQLMEERNKLRAENAKLKEQVSTYAVFTAMPFQEENEKLRAENKKLNELLAKHVKEQAEVDKRLDEN